MPTRKEAKRVSQIKYVASDKSILALFNRWAKKRKRVTLTGEQVLELRKQPCHKCGKTIEGRGLSFVVINSRKPVNLGNVLPSCGICKLIGPKDKFDAIAFSTQALRRIWKKTPMASIALQKARTSRGGYQCNQCKQVFRKKDTQIDHISPVVEIETGFVSLDLFAKRLFCDENNLQILCLSCHSCKTVLENTKRAAARKDRKNVKRT